MASSAQVQETRNHASQPKKSFGRILRAYVSLTKPRVMELLLVVTIPAMVMAQRGMPDFWLVINTLIGGGMSAGAAGSFNCYIDRDMDRLMKRTKNRPLVTGEISDRGALIFSWVLTVLSVLWLWFTTNWLAAALGAAAIFFYVVIYTIILKRHSEQNIIWGGIAGCFPVLIGWAAVTGTLEIGAWVFFLLIFVWTPAHYWPLSMKYREDYATAGVPMLGVVRGNLTVGLQVILYTWATVVSSLLMIPAANLGWIYAVASVLVGGYFIFESHRLYNQAIDGKEIKPMRVFALSISYLTVLSIAMSVDPILHFGFSA